MNDPTIDQRRDLEAALKKAGEMPSTVSVDENGVLHVKPKTRSGGRKGLRSELQATWKLITPDPNDSSRFVKMGSRKQRRAPLPGKTARRIGKEFRPVLAHAIPVKEDHKSVIRAMRVMNRKTAAKYLASKQEVSRVEL